MKRTFAIVASAMAFAFAYARNACARGDALPFTSVGSHVVTNFSGTVTSEMLDGGDAIFVYEKGSGYELEIAGQVRAWILAVGGGGAGGSGATAANLGNYGAGGGGGGGGFQEIPDTVLQSGVYSIEVGDGGARKNTSKTAGLPGNPSFVKLGVADIISAAGGGGGGSAGVGGDGGSGGGGSAVNSSTPSPGGSGSQGFAGGAGEHVRAGAGGGGAGGAGGSTSAARKAGAGGAGKASSITGEEVLYAGGGGGGSSNDGAAYIGAGGAGGGGAGGGSSAIVEAGTDGLGGGGGGGGVASTHYGGKGGSGIVIIRITGVYDVPDKPATSVSYPYTGQTIYACETNAAYTFTGDYAKTDSGQYSCDVHLLEGLKWSDGTSDSVHIDWTIEKSPNFIAGLALESWREGETANEPSCSKGVGDVIFEYFDENETALAGKPSAPGRYCVSARIEETVNYYGASSGKVPFRILGANESPLDSLAVFAKVSTEGYAGETVENAKISVTVPDGYDFYTSDNDEGDLRFCDAYGNVYWSEVREWDGETLSVGAIVPELKAGKIYYLCWGPVVGKTVPAIPARGTFADTAAEFEAAACEKDHSKQLQNHLNGLAIASWRIGETPFEPVCIYRATTNGVVYVYYDGDNAELADKPSEPGIYSLRARIDETVDYAGASAGPVEFRILDAAESPLEGLGIFAKLSVQGSVSTPFATKITVTVPAAYDYISYYNDGSDIRFCDPVGNVYPHTVDSWDDGQAKTLSVIVPKLEPGLSFYMCWGPVVGETVPAVPSGKSYITKTPVITVGEAKLDENKRLVNFIRDLKLAGWREGETANEPSCVYKISTNAVPVVYTYFDADGNALDEKPSVAGEYGVGAEIIATPNYQGATAEPVKFLILGENECPLDSLGWFRKVTFPTYPGAAMSNALVTIRFQTTDRTKAFNDYSDVRFCDADGNVYAYVRSGVNFSVLIPEFSKDSVVYMCWGPVVGKRLPEMPEYSAGETASGATASYGAATRDTSKTPLVNHWVTEPSVSLQWNEGENPALSLGSAAYQTDGEPIYVFRSYDTGEETTNIVATAVGYYRVTFIVAPGEYWAGIEKPVEVCVIGHSPYSEPIDGAEDLSASGRVLLMNRDTNPEAPVENQGWADNSPAYSTYWEIFKLVTPSSARYNLHRATESILWTRNRHRQLWHLIDCRQGNNYQTNDTAALSKSLNYLPYSATSCPIYEHEGAAPTPRHGAGQILMRNTLGAAVDSGIFTNGIGTVYFDCVNGGINHLYKGKEVFKLAVRVAEGVQNADQWTAAEVEWSDPMPLKAVKIENGVAGETVEATELALDVEKGGSSKYFYRVYVPVNCYTNARFRIERTALHPNYTGDPDNISNFILIDNIIVSHPPVKVEMTTLGAYDATRSGKQTLGQVGAFSVPFPSVADTNLVGRGKAVCFDSPGISGMSAADAVVGVKLNYRWRYLKQEFWPADGSYLSVALDKNNGFIATAPFVLPGKQGDLEYFYETMLDAPYYKYVDYTGLGAGTGKYSEEITFMTNRAQIAAAPSLGTDWFVRLRDGASDYESIDLVVERGGATERVAMELAGDHVWRGYLKNPEGAAGSVKYRFEAMNRQTPLAGYAVNTNFFKATENSDTLPVTGTIAACGAGDGATVATDDATGYTLFQIDDSVLSLTVVHADYQNFNYWHDAVNEKFVGDSVEDGSKKGTSAEKIEYARDFTGWSDMPAVEDIWRTPSFDDIRHLRGRDAYTPFPSDVDNYWSVGPGMWVSRFYADDTDSVLGKGAALQMEGCGKGYIQFTDADNAPRGLESVSFNARLSQFLNFSDFNYYDGAVKPTMTNYTFAVRAAFDANSNRDFSGNAALSAVAYLQPAKGCYELRWEQRTALWDGAGNMNGPHPSGQRLALYRWNPDGSGKMTATRLNYHDNGVFNIPETAGFAASSSYLPMFISVSNDVNQTIVTIGVKRNAMTLRDSRFTSNGDWMCIVYRDGSPLRHTAGTYGVLSSNCEGIFAYPQYAPAPAVATGHGKAVDVAFPSAFQACYGDLDADLWVIHQGRMRYSTASDYRLKAIVADPVAQTLSVYTAAAGKTDFSLAGTVAIEGFGSSGSAGSHVLPLYTTGNCSVKIAVDGDWDDVRTDVTIDSVVLRQWRGDHWANASAYVPGWTAENNSRNGATNFIFTSAWIKDKKILLSAKRASANVASSIRSPLLDGNFDRGKGLGMFAFSYSNAQENARLVLQIATNGVNYTDVANHNTEIATSYWTTVTNIDFSVMSEEERAGGLVSCYLGLHGTPGMMRIAVDPDAVAGVADETDRSRFGEVYITKVVCRDEPELDTGCWWGWNLRMVGGDDDGEKRMYLADSATDPSAIGLSLALNSSATADIADPNGKATYRQHIPFVQTPVFATNVVGEVTFKARKYGYGPGSEADDQPAGIALYGSLDGEDDGVWTLLATFAVSNSTYTGYSYKTSPGQSYRAFRLGVSGAEGCVAAGDVVPEGYASAVRVLLDEVLVSEAIRARMAFINVGVFRSDMSGTGAVPDVPSSGEQPILNEGWGVQAEVYAAQLANEIDLDRKPKVYLWWHADTYPWGFENWRALAEKNKTFAELAEADDKELTFRSSYISAPSAVVPMATAPGTVVQYSLEVIWYQAGSGAPATNVLTAADWSTPDWYRPIDYNADYGGGKAFSAYNILDAVAPGWGWINEVNIYGTHDSRYLNSDADAQFVEIAVPAGADISGWSVRMLEAVTSRRTIVTNTVAVFGAGNLSATKSMDYVQSNMSFRVIGNLNSRKNGKLAFDNGTLDGTWSIPVPTDTFSSSGEIFWTDPIGIQLVRSSGVVEHEIVTIGTNWYGDAIAEYHPTNAVAILNSKMRDAAFFYAGPDDMQIPAAKTGSSYEGKGVSIYGTGTSLGVVSSHGETNTVWSKTMRCTPGSVNEGQSINPDDIPQPNGETIVVYCNVDTAGGHIVQTVGDAVETNATQMIMIKRGSEDGTNIVYKVDPWYELGNVSVTSAGKAQSYTSVPVGERTYKVTVGRYASNTVTVVASARVDEKLRNEFGIDDNNAYTPAVMAWLEDGETLKGPFAYPDSGEILLADFIDRNDSVVTNLTLTEMYWLDMDPTVGGLALKGYMARPPEEHAWQGMVNLRMEAFAMITNRLGDAHYPSAWRPYALRGLAPGENSWDFAAPSASWGWTSVTFKVTGFLNTGLTKFGNRDNWIPLRYFVFADDSFRGEDEAAPYTSSIEIVDPFTRNSLAGEYGWYDWVQEHGDTQAYYSWTIDTRIKPVNVEVLKKENYYEE